MPILDIQLMQCENIVLMKVLDMEESLRDNGELAFLPDNTYIRYIISRAHPEIDYDTVYVWGHNISKDNEVCTFVAYTYEEAREICIDIMKLVLKVNGYKNITETPLLINNRYFTTISETEKPEGTRVILYGYS